MQKTTRGDERRAAELVLVQWHHHQHKISYGDRKEGEEEGLTALAGTVTPNSSSYNFSKKTRKIFSWNAGTLNFVFIFISPIIIPLVYLYRGMYSYSYIQTAISLS